jgi:hypothetical protein
VVCAQNHWDDFLWFGIKTGGDDFSHFDLKIGGSVFRFGPQNRQLQFGDLGLKISAMISWFEP